MFDALGATTNWLAIAPEIVLLLITVVILGYDIKVKPRDHDVHGGLAVLGVGGALAFTWAQWQSTLVGQEFFLNMLRLDGLSITVRFVLLVVLGMALLAAWPLVTELGRRGAELLALMLLATIGFSLLASSGNLVMMFIGLEIGSISLYVLAGITRERLLADEAAMKYFLLGSFASAIFIYGVALFFAGTGSLFLTALPAALASFVFTKPAVLLIALGMLATGLLFKVTAAPFHAWAPDVYQGAPAGVVGFMSASAKIGGFAALARVVWEAYGGLASDWQAPLAGVAAISIVLGTLLAISQDDIRRMLAYSGIAHAGFILIGIASGPEGRQEIAFYLAVYTIQLVAAFAVTAAVSGPGSSGSARAEYVGLARKSPLLAGVLGLMMVGMSGMPVTSGFVAKFGVFREGWNAGLGWLVIVGLVASVAAFFFYLRILVDMYFREPAETPGTPKAAPRVSGPVRAMLLVASAATILLGLYARPLLDFIDSAL